MPPLGVRWVKEILQVIGTASDIKQTLRSGNHCSCLSETHVDLYVAKSTQELKDLARKNVKTVNKAAAMSHPEGSVTPNQ